MTTTPTKNNLRQAQELVTQLRNKAEELLQAEVWDNAAVEKNAMLLSRFTDIATEAGVEDYLNKFLMRWTGEQKEAGVPFNLELWDDQKYWDFKHAYCCHIGDLEGSKFLPKGWRTSLPEKPLTLNHLEEAVEVDVDGYLYTLEDLLVADIHGDEREVLRACLVEFGYLSNQQNLTGTDAEVDAAFAQLQQAIKEITTPEAKYAAVIRKLDAIAEELVKDELWDEARIQTIAGLRYIYRDHVGTNKEAV